MNKLKSVISTIIIMTLLCTMSFTNVFAEGDDDATLSELNVRALNSSWNEVDKLSSFTFNPATTEYSVILTHDTAYVQISATTADDGASTSLPSYNYFRVDLGENTQEVEVTSADGTTLTYTIELTVLSESEEEEYIANHSYESSELATTVIDEQTYYLSPYIPADMEVPNGFERGTYTKDDKDYEVLINSKKGMNVFYLYSDDELTEGGLYVLNENDSDADEFYPLQNIKVKSRMYTIVQPEAVESYEQDKEYLDEFTLTEITIGDETVNAWRMEDDGDFYLLYAANWNGDTSLYCYDEVEECLQRYDIDSSTIRQLEAAGNSYTELQSKYNDLVTKYNTNNSRKWKMIAALGIFSIILIFVMINLILRLKSADNSDEEYDDSDDYSDDDEPIGGYEELSFDTKSVQKETDIELIIADEESDKEEDAGAANADSPKENEDADTDKKEDDKKETDEIEDDDFEFID